MPVDLSEVAEVVGQRTETLKLGGGNTLEVTIGAQSEANPEWTPARIEALKLIQDIDDLPDEEKRERLKAYYTELTVRGIFLGWPDGEVKLKGKVLKPTLENRRKVLDLYPAIREQVAQFSAGSAFKVDVEQEARAAKN